MKESSLLLLLIFMFPLQPQLAPPAPYYDEQLGLTFSSGVSGLYYNVTAVAQTSDYGYGPAYLVNGLTQDGWWYQVGLSYDWPRVTGGYASGFRANYAVFAPNGTNVITGLARLNGDVHSGDVVAVYMWISAGSVHMEIYDYNTSASFRYAYSSMGATEFMGLQNGTANSQGFFTGLMTEWYHVKPYYGPSQEVIYSSDRPVTQAFAWMDEWNFSRGSRLALFTFFSGPLQLFGRSLTYFRSHGATEAISSYEFITGSPEANATIEFVESGLPSGHVWYVELQGSRFYGNGSTIYCREPLGSYSFYVVSPGYASVPYSGQVNLTQEGALISIDFYPMWEEELALFVTLAAFGLSSIAVRRGRKAKSRTESALMDSKT
ncbi:MAG: hypothetical protein ACP5UI_03120 [Thermoprotei archaeon]